MASIVISGDTSGTCTISAQAAAGTTTLTLPTTSGTIVTTAGATTVEFAAGTASAPSITFTGDTNTGIFAPAADTVGIATGGSERMRIDSSGNVSVGTSTGNPLGNGGTVTTLAVASSGAGALSLVTSATADTSIIGVLNFGTTGASTNKTAASINAYLEGSGATNASGNLRFFTRSGADILERMRITSDGNLEIGTSGNNARLRALSTATQSQCAWFTHPTSGQDVISCENSATSGDNIFISFYTDAAVIRGKIDYNRGAGQVRYNTTSDATLKNILGDSNGQKSVDILKSTKIREFTWKDDAEQKPQIGVIAQELYETYKGAVSVGGEVEKTDEEGNVTTEYRPWGVDKTAFTFHLIAGWQAHEKLIQEQQAMIEELKASVETQAAEIQALKESK